jgi:hypothetical protein
MAKVIDTYDSALEYINRLGFGSAGKPIAWRQSDLCNVADAILRAAGVPEGKLENYPYFDQPFKVRFHRHTIDGFSYPWLSRFTVWGVNGKVTVYCTDIRC